MHQFLGYSLEEWLTLLSIIGIVGGYFVWIINKAIIRPLSSSINALSDEIKDFKKSSHERHSEFDLKIKKNEDRLDNHDVHLAEHDQQIKTLFSKGGLHYEEN